MAMSPTYPPATYRDAHVRYWRDEITIGGIAIEIRLSTAAVYLNFRRLGLPIKNSNKAHTGPRREKVVLEAHEHTGDGSKGTGRFSTAFSSDNVGPREAAERTAPVPKRPMPLSGPPIYRSDFIRGEAVRRLTAGR